MEVVSCSVFQVVPHHEIHQPCSLAEVVDTAELESDDTLVEVVDALLVIWPEIENELQRE